MPSNSTDTDTIDETDLKALIKDLEERVEQLENTQSVVSANSDVLLELVKIMTEVPAGKQIFNRALNRQKLNRLRDVVLPRRKQALVDISNELMPEPLKEQFIQKEMQLVRSVIRSISHRERFESDAAVHVRDLLTRLFKRINLKRISTPYDHSKMKHARSTSFAIESKTT